VIPLDEGYFNNPRVDYSSSYIASRSECLAMSYYGSHEVGAVTPKVLLKLALVHEAGLSLWYYEH